MKKIIMLSIFFFAVDTATHQYTDRILEEANATQIKARETHEAFTGAKQKLLQESTHYSAARKQCLECYALHGKKSTVCNMPQQNLEKALDMLRKTLAFNEEYLPTLENNNYQMNKLVGLRLMLDFLSKTSDDESSSQAIFDAINVLPKSERDVASPLWIEWSDNPAKIEDKVKNDLRDFAQEIARK